MFRKAATEDLPEVLGIYAGARKFMREHGNPNQWKDSSPSEDQLREDIPAGRLYVCEIGSRIQAVFAFIPGVDPTYLKIDGAWRNDEPYAAVHRVASRGEIPRMADRIFDWCFERCENIRVDTHEDNIPMQRAIERNGFVRCGIIYIADGSPRIAYHGIRRKTEQVGP